MTKKKDPRIEKLEEEVYISEAYLTALFWNTPSLYRIYPLESLNVESFMNRIWGFYFGLGRFMADKNVTLFDDITFYKFVTDLKVDKQTEAYGGFQTMSEIMTEVKGKEDNFQAYYDEVKKYKIIKNLMGHLGFRVIDVDGKYDYHNLDYEQIHTYWLDKINEAGLDGDSKFVEKHLLKGLREAIDKWDEDPDIGLDFYDSKMFTDISNGWAHGNVYIFGSFSGRGKTSFTIAKVILSCIKHGEKLLIIANEQSEDEWKKMLLITAMGQMKAHFNRKNINKGDFTENEKDMLYKAVDWIEEMIQGQDDLISLVFLDDYTIQNIKKTIVKQAHRGYDSVIIDTAKPSEDRGQMPRWERFTEDMKEIYKLAKADGASGLNLRMWVNVQLTDGALNMRFLNEGALGDSKKIKNEASVVYLMRTIWMDEYEGEPNELQVWRWIKNDDPINDNAPPYKKKFSVLKQFDNNGNRIPYALIFTPKNRRGQSNDTGLEVLVVKPNYNSNTWTEIGWASVAREGNY